MASLYLGIRLPEKPFERLKLTNIDLDTKNVAALKIEAEKILNFPHNELGKCNNDWHNVKFSQLMHKWIAFFDMKKMTKNGK